MERCVRLRLHDIDQTFAHQLEDCNKGDRHAHPPFRGIKQRDELYEARALKRRDDIRHALAHRQALALDVMMGEQLRAGEDILERDQHLLQGDLRQRAYHAALTRISTHWIDIALQSLEAVYALRRHLETLVFLQAAH